MRKFNLQMFDSPTEAVKGKKLIYLYRIYDNGTTQTGAAIAFTTENSRSVSKDADATATKDGTVRTPGEAEIEISCTSILTKGDTLINALEDAMLANKLMEIWEVNLEEPGTGDNKFAAIYYQGYLTSFEKSSNAEDFVECSLDFGINGTGARGEATVSASQQEAASYVFADTTTRSAQGATGATGASGTSA